jgi:hypothetical protein
MVIDLPLNTADGMNLPNDLAAGQLLGVGMQWDEDSSGPCSILGRDYRLMGVEFFESLPGGTSPSGATISIVEPDCACAGN